MAVFVDLQGFKNSGNKFIIKELAGIRLLNPSAHFCWCFKSPFPWHELEANYQSMNSWCTRCYHGIPWDDGCIPYDQLESKFKEVLENTKKIYVKGYEKKIWIEELTRIPVINLKDLECPALFQLRTLPYKPHKEHHSKHLKNYHCAFENAQRMRAWFIENWMT
uniref:Uncharacterized protein n=1 Tax=Bracon brevicornis TaxID=1563983 RepID=A0A6V7L8W6_9HYME